MRINATNSLVGRRALNRSLLHHATGIITAGGLGREIGAAAILRMSYDCGGEWPPQAMELAIDATRDTGRRASGVVDQLPPAPSGYYRELILPDLNIRAIGANADDPEMWRREEIRTLYEIIPPKAMAKSIGDTAAIGGYQRPLNGTVQFILNFDKINESVIDLITGVRNLAGSGRADIVVIAGANGAIGSSFGPPLGRLVREILNEQGRFDWRVIVALCRIQPYGQTPDPRLGDAISYALLKDLSVSSVRG